MSHRRAVILLAVALLMTGCPDRARRAAEAMTGGIPDRGAAIIVRYGCGSCHVIPGIAGARGQVGPPLGGMRSRTYVAGVLTNTATNLERWISDPHTINPETAMPNLGVSTAEARDIAAYLYWLR